MAPVWHICQSAAIELTCIVFDWQLQSWGHMYCHHIYTLKCLRKMAQVVINLWDKYNDNISLYLDFSYPFKDHVLCMSFICSFFPLGSYSDGNTDAFGRSVVTHSMYYFSLSLSLILPCSLFSRLYNFKVTYQWIYREFRPKNVIFSMIVSSIRRIPTGWWWTFNKGSGLIRIWLAFFPLWSNEELMHSGRQINSWYLHRPPLQPTNLQ